MMVFKMIVMIYYHRYYQFEYHHQSYSGDHIIFILVLDEKGAKPGKPFLNAPSTLEYDPGPIVLSFI